MPRVRQALVLALCASGCVVTAVSDGGLSSETLPLTFVAEVALPGQANRFDYQDIDARRERLVIAHMNDAHVVVVDLADGSVVRVLPDIPKPRGVVVAREVGRIFVTSTPDGLVIIDADELSEIERVATGTAPDGVAWDPTDDLVAVSDQGDGAVSLIADAGSGARSQIPLGDETGNVVFDPRGGVFWAAVANESVPDQIVRIDPGEAAVTRRIEVPGCVGAHGLRIHPDGASAFVACEGNDTLVRVPLEGSAPFASGKTGAGADVLTIDPALGWLYVASESGDLVVFDIERPGVVPIDREQVWNHAHSVAVDPVTHRVFLPLEEGANGVPALRIMEPSRS